MKMILIVNVGSTSFKFQLLNSISLECIAKGHIDRVLHQDSLFKYYITGHEECHKILDTSEGYLPCIHSVLKLLEDNRLVEDMSDIMGIGFKAVMAGSINYPAIVTEKVLDEMRKFNFVAPAHNPPYIQVMELFRSIEPNIPLVAVFETAFHRTMPDYATVYPYPSELRSKYDLRKFGFHGASHSYMAWKIPQIVQSCKPQKIVSCHLGGSSSICAIKDGQSIDTSMGFSPQSGLPMNNRNGDLDVFSVLYLMKEENLSPEDARELLSTQSGLKGISGISEDVRALKGNGNPMAILALESLAYHAKKYIGSYIAAMNGVDIIAFTGGIGENDADMRRRICRNMDYLGIKMDDKKNKKVNRGVLSQDGIDISDSASRVRILVIPANEEIMVAKQTIAVIENRGN